MQNELTEILRCDGAVIGAGTAGLAAERAAHSNGATTLLIDPYFNGTTCATVGCMPSKLLIAASHAAHAARSSGQFGIEVRDVRIDGKAVMQRVRTERDRFVRLTKESIEEIPDGVRLRGLAKFMGAQTLSLDDGRMIEAGSIVIATGSSPSVPDAFAKLGDRILTNETIFDRTLAYDSKAVGQVLHRRAGPTRRPPRQSLDKTTPSDQGLFRLPTPSRL